MKKVCVITGTRAEYGYLKPLMEMIKKEPSLELIPIITGMHLLSEYGNSYLIVKKDFPNSTLIKMDLSGDNLKDMAIYLSSGIRRFANHLNKTKPDIIIVLGDRSEPLAAALAAFYLNIPIAHLNGGDVTGGTIDESIRHCLTKLSHIHFVHTKSNAERIKKMGEEEHRIFISGALSLDAIASMKFLSKNEIYSKYQLDPSKKTFLVVHHPITTLRDRGFAQFKELMEAIDTKQEQTILLYPNCDAGGKRFISLIKTYEKKSYMYVFKNLNHLEYLSFMKSVDILIGNSSSGIIEAPSFYLPVINVGNRQQGRERSENIIDVEPKKEKILNAIDFAFNDRNFIEKVKRCTNKFGDGTAAQKIIKVLKNITLDETFIRKKITY